MPAIEVNELTKVFDGVVAVNNVSYEVEEGEVFGLVGLNGAGKSSTILMLSTLLHPTSGGAKVLGHDILREKNEVRKSIGVVFEDQAVDSYLTGRQNLDFAARMYGLSKADRKKRVSELLKTVGLEDQANIKVKDYSGGMIRRLEIARGMLFYPQILFLDEPTIGLDVQTRRYLWNFTLETNKTRGTTVFIATSYLDEADYLCERVAIMHKGKIVTIGKPIDLKASIGGRVISVKLGRGSQEKFASMIEQTGWVSDIKMNESLHLGIKENDIGIPDIVRLANRNGFYVSAISSHVPTLDDVLLHYTGRKVEE
ncbi:MAG: ATP-binding cassette domain-containing protein [Actinomycetota bacterium]|nr:ATP-binding cassette domain-containing protein [Actinomycetota bacterium]